MVISGKYLNMVSEIRATVITIYSLLINVMSPNSLGLVFPSLSLGYNTPQAQLAAVTLWIKTSRIPVDSENCFEAIL